MDQLKNPIISIKDLSFHYGNQYVLENINFELPRGAFLGLVGPNGSGKSTLIKNILGILKPHQGSIFLFDVPIQKFKSWDKIGYVSQKANSFNSGFPATVFEVVSMGLYGKIGLFRFLKKDHKQKVYDALQTVGMREYSSRNIGELSGGQQQRVFIARALVSDPELLILDEPTVGIDAKSVKDFYDLLGRLNKEKGLTMLLVTHDVGAVSDKITHVACINKTLFFHGQSDEFEKIQKEGLSSFYGHDVHVLNHNHGG
ncbi:metal ABC transporter ATP-binding protein [Bacillus taeanensis]|uniref:Zinc ABC transporter ATP-binding protein n=1 Tax=Bacillus taeanensis TaxID=273032 RepID=A0A366Y2U9_9BACI|nr:metal ABC transporter ATP-binding protein [Bacillus taeanensis]RBW70531.1 zinc ABC transporter ATP-binding protein [Bacillus taeanensis]